MSCFYPVVRFWNGSDYVINKFQDRDDLNKFMEGQKIRLQSDLPLKSMLVPCGRCDGCRLDRAKDWTTRLALEKTLYPDGSTWFLTLTYDVPPMSESGLPSLRLSDFQDFWKRLRYHYGELRYFMCGEYGDINFRPHGHAIVFGFRPSDLRLHSYSDQGLPYYVSETVSSIWNHGFTLVAPADLASMAYVARYVLKKQAAFSYIGDVTPPFVRMSNRPGIGSGFFDKALYDYDKLSLPGGSLASFPRYFDKKLADLDPELLADHKARRQFSGILNAVNQLDYYSKSYADVLLDKAETLALSKKTRDFS